MIEKTLKAYFWFKKEDDPPYTHNLILLSNKSELTRLMSKEQIEFLNVLMPLNIEGRYPSDKELIRKQLNEIRMKEILDKTIELNKWIKVLIKY
ncbi:MAG: HEPN domain-containing protein [Ignavibacteriae bacterium]|nr:HEPN domain-containing protein [Ignavibacteriota bacterium]